jgi:hypothetical protein
MRQLRVQPLHRRQQRVRGAVGVAAGPVAPLGQEGNSKKAGRTPQQAGMKLLRQPFKPKHNFLCEDIRVYSWQTWLGEAYWLTELENDME